MRIQTPEEELDGFVNGPAQNLSHALDEQRWHRYVVARHLAAIEADTEDAEASRELDRELRARLTAAHCDEETIDALLERLRVGLLVLGLREMNRYYGS